MRIQLQVFTLAAVTLLAFLPTPQVSAVTLPSDINTLNYYAPVTAIEPLQAVETPGLGHLDLQPFKFAPMGTYANSFAPHNCTWGAASMKGNITWGGNANQWDDAARARGIPVTSEPVVGAVAQTDRGYYGHVAVVTDKQGDTPIITEMNYDGAGGVRTRPANPSEFIYINL